MKRGYKTVLILGAGVSKPYGFPLASELLPLIGSLRSDAKFQAYAKTHGHSDDDLGTFFDATSIDFHGTIDEYLRKNPRHISVGLSAIAWVIMRHEKKGIQGTVVVPSSFYRVLFDFLRLDPETGDPEHDVSVITLNYDRSLEYWLERMIVLCVGEDHQDAARKRLAAIKMHHLHGTLGSFDELPYATKPTESAVKDASARLMTIHRRNADFTASYAVAIEMMKQAAMVFVLGCSYDPTIFRDLFPGFQDGGFYSRSGISRIYGTVIGHNDAMESRISEVFRSDDLIQAKPSEHPAQFLPRAAGEFHTLVLERAAQANTPEMGGWQSPPGRQRSSSVTSPGT